MSLDTASDGLRRPHSKSRHGCAKCKQRRVRCDLRSPSCSHCERRGDVCEYPTSTAGSRTEIPDSMISIGFELGIHFDALTSSTFDLPETPNAWRQVLIKPTADHDYVRQGSLALAALHMIHLRPNETEAALLYRKACTYHSQACAIFRGGVHAVTQENGPSILAFCVMTVIFNFSTSLVEYQSSLGNQSIDVIGPLMALRSGASLLASNLQATVHNENLSGALGRLGRDLSNPLTSTEPQTQAALDALEAAVSYMQHRGCLTPATLHAFRVLCQCLQLFPQPKGWLHVTFWPALLEEKYVAELQLKTPAAIVVFVYWCAYLNNFIHQWYLEKWPRVAASYKITQLEGMWDCILAWPRDTLGLS